MSVQVTVPLAPSAGCVSAQPVMPSAAVAHVAESKTVHAGVASRITRFESAPVPGFSGTPINLLVLLDAKGGFTDVKVLSHHEPVFLEGLGDGVLVQFVDQYRGL